MGTVTRRGVKAETAQTARTTETRGRGGGRGGEGAASGASLGLQVPATLGALLGAGL